MGSKVGIGKLICALWRGAVCRSPVFQASAVQWELAHVGTESTFVDTGIYKAF